MYAGQQEVAVAIADHDPAAVLARRQVTECITRTHARPLDALPPLIDDLALDLTGLEQIDVRQAERAIGAPSGLDEQCRLFVCIVGVFDARVQFTGSDVAQPVHAVRVARRHLPHTILRDTDDRAGDCATAAYGSNATLHDHASTERELELSRR